MSNIDHANVMILGRSGVGKSSFINYLIGENVCETGFGLPVTKGFDTYEFNSVDGIPIRIFDSKGLESLDLRSIRKDIIDYITTRCGNNNISDWIHTVFYCFNVESGRVLPEEIKLLKELRGRISQSIHIILTHCNNTPEGLKKADRMKRHIVSELHDKKVRIYCVNSVLTENFHGVYEQFGRKEILDGIFKQLWSDIAQKISVQYARELYAGSHEYIDRAETECYGFVEKLDPIGVIVAAIKDEEEKLEAELDEEIGGIETKLLAYRLSLDAKYRERISGLVAFCNAYGRTMTGDLIEHFDSFDILPERAFDVDFDGINDNSKMGRLVNDIDHFESYDFWGKTGTVFKAIGGVFGIRHLTREYIRDMINALRESIPDENEIADSVYEKLMGAFNCEEHLNKSLRFCEKVDAGEEVTVSEGMDGLINSLESLKWMMTNVG